MGIEHIRKAYKELVRRRHRFWLSLSERGQKTFILGGSILLTCGFFFQIIKQWMNPLGKIPKDEKHLYNNDNYFRAKREKELLEQSLEWQRRGKRLKEGSSGLTWNEEK